MSEKRSWDIQPRRSSSTPQRAPPRERRKAPASVIRRETVKQGRDREPLKARRRRRRWRLATILFILALALIGGGVSALWASAFRIQHVEAVGPDASGIEATAMDALTGTEHYVIPTNSIFFFPEDTLRAKILKQYSDISAVSISRTSLDTIYISSVPRESAFLWCGSMYTAQTTAVVLATSTPEATTTAVASIPTQSSAPMPCYDADAQGDVFATDLDASPDTLRVYDPLASSSAATSSPFGQYVDEAGMIANALQFVKAIKSLGVPIVSLVIRGDEADLYAQSGTRITYVLGTEEQTAVTAESAFPSLDLDNGSLAYVDLRFAGKVYYKKADSTTTANNLPQYSSAVSCYLTGKCQIH